MNENQIDIDKLWAEYKSNTDISNKHKLITQYLWLVKYAISNMPIPSNSILEENDFLSVGMIALSDTIDKFEIERGIKFETYAIKRIKGIIKDELRRVDYLSRSTRKKAQDYQLAVDKVRVKYEGEVSTEEIRKNLNVSPEKFKSYLEAAAIAKATISLNESNSSMVTIDDETYNLLDEIPDEGSNFLEDIDIKERKSIVFEFLQKLKENQRIIITLYYFENLTFKEIGKVLNVSESRISQIHSQVLKIGYNYYQN